MFFGKINRLRHTLAFRLTLWYASIFVLSSAVAFSLFYLLIVRLIEQRTDTDLQYNANRLAQIYTLEGSEMLQRAAHLQVHAVGEQKMFFRLFYPSGIFFSSSNMSYWRNIGIDRKAVDAILEQGRPYSLRVRSVPGQRYQARIIYKRISPTIVLQLGYSMESAQRLIDTFNRTFLLVMAVLLITAAAVGWFMARRALTGVASVMHTAQQISEDDLDTRVPIKKKHDELDQLAVTFNQMLDRIKNLVSGTRQMNDNIAHDLRSPITRIRGLAEVTLTNAGTVDDYAQMAASSIEECDRLLEMINTMLTISRTEAGVDRRAFEPLDLSAMVDDACTLFQPLAEDKGIALNCNVASACLVDGNEPMLQRLLSNLIDNAIKYTGPDGAIDVGVHCNQTSVRITVKDNGPGIPEQDQPRVFHRFFRGDQSRTLGGAGLGLSLAQAIARAHGGHIALESKSGQGAAFIVHLPLSRENNQRNEKG